MLNAALYCVLRFLPDRRRAARQASAARCCVVFGGVSLMVGAGFILFQHDAKRLLAYCSVEHIGLIALGLGLGRLGVAAALFHSLNHSLAKCLAFFAVGPPGPGLRQPRHHAAERGLPRLAALGGRAPGQLPGPGRRRARSASFLSELLILKAAFDGGAWLALADRSSPAWPWPSWA